MHHWLNFFLLGMLPALSPLASLAQDFSTVRVASGLANPLYATAAPNDPSRLFILEQNTGNIRILDLQSGTVLTDPFMTVSGISAGGERGLLGMAFDPLYASNGYFYLNYTDAAGNTQISRYQVSPDPNYGNPATATPILSVAQPFSNHNGGWMAFGPDGYLYVAMGDGGSGNDPGNRAQNKDELLGKMLRLDIRSDAFPADPNRNYGIPATNPFVGAAGADEVWAYGLRNPWRPSFDRLTGDLYIADVGQGAWEEVNFQPAGVGGLNYGWRVMEGNHVTGLGGGTGPFVAPIHEYNHPGGASRSITGGYVYRGNLIPELQGTYFFADFITGQIWSFRYDGTTLTELTERTSQLIPDVGGIGNISSFGEDANGELYIVDYDGEIFMLIPEPGTWALLGIGLLLVASKLIRTEER